MDAGGLAQMSYNSFPAGNGLGLPSSGFASRGKGSHIKHLSFEPSKAHGSLDNGAPTPRTSRSHLLAGLRTAPKSATTASFSNASGGIDSSVYADKENGRYSYAGPKTSIGANFSTQQTGFKSYNGNRQMYSLPEQVLAPPQIQIDEHNQDEMDPNLYAQLVATNMYLAEQQQRLQQQLMNVQAAAQQFQGMNLSHMGQMQQQFATPPLTPGVGMYQQQQQQLQNNMQPIVTQVSGAQAGIYSVYNPMTGQQSYFMEPNAQQNQFQDAQHANVYANSSPPQQPGTPTLQISPPNSIAGAGRPQPTTRSISPPKKSISPPQDHAPLPPPSTGAFRRGHGRASSVMTSAVNTSTSTNDNGPRSSVLPKTMNFPAASTPVTGTFGPGAARAGEHPIRQPRGPPSLDELRAKPTTKHEGSKNFATRQRRSAVNNLVRAGMERRRSPGSGGSMSPVSEVGEPNFSDNDDSDSNRSGSGSLSGRPAVGSPRTSAHGAIGSDRPSSREKQRYEERKSVDSNFTTATVSSDEGIGGSFAAVFKNAGKNPETSEVSRKAPMLVLSSAEKRKNSAF